LCAAASGSYAKSDGEADKLVPSTNPLPTFFVTTRPPSRAIEFGNRLVRGSSAKATNGLLSGVVDTAEISVIFNRNEQNTMPAWPPAGSFRSRHALSLLAGEKEALWPAEAGNPA
jgi:hypothetical protein